MLKKGRVLVLNGPSSSGKSSIARELVRLWGAGLVHLEGDVYEREQEGHDLPYNETIKNFDLLATQHAENGIDVVVVTVFQTLGDLIACLENFRTCEAFLIGVRCAVPVLKERELRRGDRSVGLAADQNLVVHRHGIYDFEVDSSTSSVVECANEILKFVQSGTESQAFGKLRQKFRLE